MLKPYKQCGLSFSVKHYKEHDYAATNPKIEYNQIFHIHDSWDLDTVKRKHTRIVLAECSIPKQLVHQKFIDNYMERKKKGYTAFLACCFMFHCRELGDRDIDWPCLTEAVPIAVVFFLLLYL